VGDQYGPPEKQRDMAARLEAVFATRSRDAWVEALGGLEACVGPVHGLAEAFADQQVSARSLVAEVDGVAVGPGSPFRFDGERAQDGRRAPGFGEHTAEVLAWIGVTDEELADLRARGVT
jgi:alpha-methylacyl-CoA racemase